MRAILPAIALFAVLTTAGPGLAALETVTIVTHYAEGQSDATYEYAWDSVDRAFAVAGPSASDLEAKAAAARALAEAAADNAGGQAAATGNLAVTIAAESAETAEAIAAMELAAASQALVLTQVLSGDAVFTKESLEAIAVGAANAAPGAASQLPDHGPAADVATSAATAAGALAVTMALEKQAATVAFLNAVIEA